MPAETAAPAPSVTSAPESQVETASTEVPTKPGAGETPAATPEDHEHDHEQAQETAQNTRLKAILEEEGLPAEEIEGVTKPKGKTDAKKTETPGSDQTSERTGDRRPENKPEDKSQKSEVSKTKDKAKPEGAEEVTEAERQTWPKEALERIGKLTAQKKTLQQQVQRAASASRPTPTAADPMADVSSPEEFQAAVKEYRDMREWAQQNPDGFEKGAAIGTDAKGQPIVADRDYSAKEMAAIVARSTRILEEAAPRKAAILHEQHLHEQVARERCPEMFEEGTEANAFYQNALHDLPGLRNLPGMANMIRWAWIGRQQDIAAQPESGARKPERKVDPKAAPFLQKHPPQTAAMPEARVQTNGASRGGGKGNGSDEDVTKAKERVLQGAGEEAETDFVGSLRAKQAQREGAVLV